MPLAAALPAVCRPAAAPIRPTPDAGATLHAGRGRVPGLPAGRFRPHRFPQPSEGTTVPHAISIIPTRDGSRLIKRLCTHWAHRLEVQFDELQAQVPFDETTHLRLDAGAEALQARLEAADDARLVQMQGVVADHLHRMARGEVLEIEWEPGAGSAA
jgi:hypothetical protein